MKKLLLILLCLPMIGFGQEWTFGGTNQDQGYSVQQTSDGGYILCGDTYSFGNGSSDIFLVKTDGSGNEQWAQTFGSSSWEHGKFVQQTSDGGYIIAGDLMSNDDLYVIKTDVNGIEVWNQTYNANAFDNFNSIKQTNDGGYIISTTSNSDYVYLIKTDASGTEQWSQTFGGSDYDAGYSVQQTTDGGYIINGWTSSLKWRGRCLSNQNRWKWRFTLD